MRNKKQSLQMLRERGFHPDLIIDVGVASGTDGLYEVWPTAHHVLVEPQHRFGPDLDRICASLPYCEQIIAAAGDQLGEGVTTVDKVASDRLLLNSAAKIVLKIDVDGPEMQVLAGSSQTLTADCVIIIEAAFLDRTMARFGLIVRFLTDCGYEVFDILEPLLRPSDEFLWQVDLVFVRRESRFRRSILYYEPLPM